MSSVGVEHLHDFRTNGDFGNYPRSIGQKSHARSHLYAYRCIGKNDAGLWLHRQGRQIQPPHDPRRRLPHPDHKDDELPHRNPPPSQPKPRERNPDAGRKLQAEGSSGEG